MFYALTGQVHKLRIAKQYASAGIVLFLFFWLITYEVIMQLFVGWGLIVAGIFLGGYFFQTGVFGLLGFCMRGHNASQDCTVQFAYVTVLFAIPLLLVETVQVIPGIEGFLYIVYLLMIIFSVILYSLAMRAVYDIASQKIIAIVLGYLFCITVLILFLIWLIVFSY